MGIISLEQQDRLYWLGRYTERVYTTLRMYSQSYDMMIDEITDSYQEFCKMIDIPDIYGSKDEFKKKYPFDESNPDSIISNLTRAYVLSGKETKVWPSGLTRFSRNPDSFVVNSSQGGGFKDTWVLSR